jgi:hypothetical protein
LANHPTKNSGSGNANDKTSYGVFKNSSISLLILKQKKE